MTDKDNNIYNYLSKITVILCAIDYYFKVIIFIHVLIATYICLLHIRSIYL